MAHRSTKYLPPRWVLALLASCSYAPAARALPSFAAQTGQPCAACHVGAFGPQLRPYGRDFKLNGYTSSDGGNHFPPIAAMTLFSFTHTAQDESPAARWFAPNDNFALDQASLYYAGAITRHLGAFIQTTYDGVARQYQIDNTDIRYARERDIFGIDSVWGLTLNNNPTVQDLWNSTPTWGFPYNASPLARTPAAATRIDGSFAQQVMGIGAYVMWNDWVYTEADLYRGLGRDIRNALGTVPVSGTDSVVDTVPYWRVAVQHDFGRSNWEIGTYGIAAHILPGGVSPSGKTDSFTDVAADANWQFTVDPAEITSNIISTHATLIHEDQDLAASAQLTGANRHGDLTTMRADMSYSLGATITPSFQLFRTEGSDNAAYWSTPTGRPGSDGAIVEVAYVPFGKPDSIIHWGNLRLAVQYVFYTRFDGQTQGAAHNDTLYLSLWAAWHF
jgi:hypothetical protein